MLPEIWKPSTHRGHEYCQAGIFPFMPNVATIPFAVMPKLCHSNPYNGNLHIKLLWLTLCSTVLETGPKISTNPECGSMSPDKNTMDGTYITCAEPAVLASRGTLNQVKVLVLIFKVLSSQGYQYLQDHLLQCVPTVAYKVIWYPLWLFWYMVDLMSGKKINYINFFLNLDISAFYVPTCHKQF